MQWPGQVRKGELRSRSLREEEIRNTLPMTKRRKSRGEEPCRGLDREIDHPRKRLPTCSCLLLLANRTCHWFPTATLVLPDSTPLRSLIHVGNILEYLLISF